MLLYAQRFETLTRLTNSAVFIPWKSYLMTHDHASPLVCIKLAQIKYFIKSPLQDCLLMAGGTSITIAGSALYCGSGAFVRYLYVRSSLQKEIQVCLYLHFERSLMVYLRKGSLQERPVCHALYRCPKDPAFDSHSKLLCFHAKKWNWECSNPSVSIMSGSLCGTQYCIVQDYAHRPHLALCVPYGHHWQQCLSLLVPQKTDGKQQSSEGCWQDKREKKKLCSSSIRNFRHGWSGRYFQNFLYP